MAQRPAAEDGTKARFAEMKSRDEALLMAFAGDSFDAAKLDLAPRSEPPAGSGGAGGAFAAGTTGRRLDACAPGGQPRHSQR